MQKRPGNEASMIETIRKCLQSLKEAARVVAPLVERVNEDKLDDDFLTEIGKYGDGFSEVRDALDAIPVKDGKYLVEVPKEEEARVEALMAELIDEVKLLNDNQEIIIGGLKVFMEQNSHRMEVLRKARGIFDKFVKKPPQSPRFFDRKG